MPSYLQQFQRFSEGITRSLEGGRQGLLKGAQAALDKEARRQKYALEQQIKNKKQVASKLYGESFSGMYDWMAEDMRAEQAYFNDKWNNGELSDYAQLESASAALSAGAKQYQNITSQYEGDPNDDPLKATRHGMLNALTEMEQGRNPWNEVDQKPVDNYDMLVADVASKYGTFQKGKTETEVYLGGRMDESTGKWMVKFGDPNDPETWVEIDRNTFIANLEGGNAYAPSNGFNEINIPTIRELASENQVKNFVGGEKGAENTYYMTMMTGSGDAHNRFKKAVFDELAPDYLSGEEEAVQMRRLFLGDAMGVSFDRANNKLEFENVDPRIQKMIEAGMDRFGSSYTEAVKPTSSSATEYPNENKVFAESWNPDEAVKAYESKPKPIAMQALEMLNLPVPPRFRQDTDVMNNIKEMVALSPYELEAGGGEEVHAVAQDRDGNLIAKIVAKTEQPLTPQQQMAGMPPTVSESTYYKIIPDELKVNAYKRLGLLMNPKSTNPTKEGEKYLYEKYQPTETNTEPTPVDPPSPRSVSVETIGGLPFEDKPVSSFYDPNDAQGRYNLQIRLNNAFRDDSDSLYWFNWLNENPGQIEDIMSEIDKGNIPVWKSPDGIAPSKLVFEKQE